MVDLVLVNQCCLPGNNGLNSRSGPHGISTNVALLKGGLLRYNVVCSKLLRHIGLLEADEDKIRKIRPKGTLVTILYVPREAICPKGG